MAEDPDFQKGQQITLEQGREKEKKRDIGFQDGDLCSGAGVVKE